MGANAGVTAGLRALLATACGVSVANVYYAQPLLDRIGTDLNVGADRLGLVTAVTQLGYLLGLVLIVPLGDLVSRRLLIVAQALVAAAALAAVGLSGGTAVFFAASAVVGTACAVVQVIVAYAAALSAPGQRGTVVGTVTSGVVVGILLARTASGFAADLLGWRAVYLVSAGLMLTLGVALGCLLPRDNSWLLQSTLLNRPGNKDAMLDLLYDYRTNPGLYPRWHEYFRAHQPPTLITWGRNDEIFPEAGALPYRNDLPRAEIAILDAGHFALEDHADVIAQHISRFTAALPLPAPLR